jgi:hypothetical protein
MLNGIRNKRKGGSCKSAEKVKDLSHRKQACIFVARAYYCVNTGLRNIMKKEFHELKLKENMLNFDVRSEF